MSIAKTGGKNPTTKATSSSRKSPAELRLEQAQRAALLLKHVSDPTRLQVVLMLAEGERYVGDLCAQLSQSQPALSHHLALLRHGGIIAPRRQGKNTFYGLTEKGAELVAVVGSLSGNEVRIPNAATRQALLDAEQGRNLIRYASFTDFAKAMTGE